MAPDPEDEVEDDLEEEPQLDTSFKQTIVVDGLPVVPKEKHEKLANVVRKFFSQAGSPPGGDLARARGLARHGGGVGERRGGWAGALSTRRPGERAAPADFARRAGRACFSASSWEDRGVRFEQTKPF